MRGSIGKENQYLALETGDALFAIPIGDTRGVVIGSQVMKPTVLPHMPNHIKYVAMVRGQLTTIITLPGNETDEQLLGKIIVILEHPDRNIGVIASNVRLIAIPEKNISVDRLTGTKTYTEGSNTFSILDIENLFNDKEYGV